MNAPNPDTFGDCVVCHLPGATWQTDDGEHRHALCPPEPWEIISALRARGTFREPLDCFDPPLTFIPDPLCRYAAELLERYTYQGVDR